MMKHPIVLYKVVAGIAFIVLCLRAILPVIQYVQDGRRALLCN